MTEKLNKAQSFIEAIGLVSVIAGLIFVVIELRQGQEQMAAQTRQAISQGAINFLYRENESAEFSDLLMRGDSGQKLTPVENYRYTLHVVSMFVYWENYQYQFEAGMLEEDEYNPQLKVWKFRISSPGRHRVWCQQKRTFSKRLALQLDKLMKVQCIE